MIENIFYQLIQGVIFILLSVVIFTGMGLGIKKATNIRFNDLFEVITISTALGIAAFTLTAYVLAALNLRFLMWLLPVIGLINLLRYFASKPSLKINLNHKEKIYFFMILVIGIIAQLAVTVPSGFPYKDGLYFWSSHGHDGIWHIALMEEMHKNVYPFQNPELAGAKLQNYHFFVDLLMSEMTRLFRFSNLDVYFRFMPLLFSILFGLSSFTLARQWSRQNLAGFWAMFFTYFSGSFGYLLTLPRAGNLSGEAVFWVSQTHSSLGNPPHAAAFILLMSFLLLLSKFFQDRNIKFILMMAILGGVLIEFKVYAGVLVLGGLLCLAIWEIIYKHNLRTLVLFILVLIISLLIYIPNSSNSQDFLVWQPWWFIHTMVVAPDRLNWLDMELRRQTYIVEGNWKRVIQLEATAFLIFLFGNLGMRFLGFFEMFKEIRKNIFKDSFNLFFLIITVTSFVLPVLFVQKGIAWNLIQFNQYFLLLFGFYAALATALLQKWIRQIWLKYLFIVILIVLSVPTQIGLLIQFYANPPLSKVSYEEKKALDFLKSNSIEESIILTGTFDRFARTPYSPPVPIFSWYDTGYVPAFSGRRTLISDTEQLDIMGYEIDDLAAEKIKLFPHPDPSVHHDPNPQIFNDFVAKYRIGYLYLVYNQKTVAPVEQLNMDLVYESENIKIYKIR